VIAQGVTYLADGTRESNDVAYSPDAGRVPLRGLGVSLTVHE
jgi:hypothetical protein